MRSKPLKSIPILFLVVIMLLAACSGGLDSSFEEIGSAEEFGSFDAATTETVAMTETTAAATRDAAAEAPADQDGEVGAADTLGAGGVEGAVLQTSTLGRDIIFTADMTVAVTDVAAAGAEATRIIQELGGYLFGQETRGAPEPYSVLTFKVLPGDFQEALARLGTVGEIRTQNVSADDVTERVVDLESRIATAEASVDRLKGFLEQATDIETIAELENQLLQRETDLETMRGSLRTLQDRVDLATIYLTLTEALSSPGIGLNVTSFPGHDEGISCPGDDGRIREEENEKATVCFEIINTGDTPLAGIELKDTVLEVELSDLIVVWGDPEGVLEPGQSLVLAHEITVERNLRTQTRVSAEPVDQDGNRVEGRDVAGTISLSIEAIDPGGLPGFQDGLQASWEALLWIGGVIVLAAGVTLPLVIPLALLGALLVWLSRRRKERAKTPKSSPPPPWVEEAPTADEPEAEKAEPESTD